MAKLQKRKGKNNWEICYPLPVKLRNFLKTPALNRSLGTPDKAEAQRRFPVRLTEVQAEVASLMAKYFPDDETALQELQDLLSMLKTADEGAGEPGELSEKEILLDVAAEWGQRQKAKRLNAYRGTAQFDEQKEIANQIMVKAGQLVEETLDPRLKITDLIEAWRQDVKPKHSISTQNEYERAIFRFEKWRKGRGYHVFDEITRRRVREFVAENYHGRMGKTVNLALGGLGGVWEHARTIGWVDEKPRIWQDHGYQNNVRVGTGEKKTAADERVAFSFDDIRNLLEGMKPQPFADIIHLGIIAGGGRSAELTSLSPKHVMLKDDGDWISLPGTKMDAAPRTVPIAKKFTLFIERLLAQKGRFLVPLFPRRVWKDERDRNNYANKELNRKRRDLQLENGQRQGIHSTRYLYIEMLEAAGVALDTAKLLVGHKRTDITFGGYSSGSLVDTRQAVEQMSYPEGIVGLINATWL